MLTRDHAGLPQDGYVNARYVQRDRVVVCPDGTTGV